MDVDIVEGIQNALTFASPLLAPRPSNDSTRTSCLPLRNKQSHRQRQSNKPYGARPDRGPRPGAGENGQPPQAGSSSSLASRMNRPKPINPKRLPAGTPPILKGDAAQRAKEKKASQSKLGEMLRSEEMKQWLRSRLIETGVLNMAVSDGLVQLPTRNSELTRPVFTGRPLAQGTRHLTPRSPRRT